MKRSADFTFSRHEQPRDETWNALAAFAAEWNKRETPKLSKVMDFLWTIKFPDRSDPAYSRFTRAIDAIGGVKYHVTSETIFDYPAMDFVEILGISLEGFKKPFIVNEAEALGQPEPCGSCGWSDMFSRPQRSPFEINEELLDRALPEGGDKPKGGWDCVNLPNGHKLVSQRIVDLLRNERVSGYEIVPVLAGGTCKKSSRMVQLLAKRSILPLGPHACPACGATLPSAPEELDFCVKKVDLGHDEVFSQHPGRGAMLYFSQRVYRSLSAGRFNGIVPGDATNYCAAG